jgi:Flp pilus assembly protein CpaB
VKSGTSARYGHSVIVKVKRMKAARLVVLVVAVAAGGLAALLAGRGGEEAPPPEAAKPAAQIDTVDVLVARNDIQLGQSVSQGDMQWQIWPVSAASPAFIRQAETLALRSLADASDTALPPTEEERNAGRKVGINTVRFGVSTVTTPK